MFYIFKLLFGAIIPSHRPVVNRPSEYRAPSKSSALSEAEIKGRIADLPVARVKYVIDGDTVIVSQGWSEVGYLVTHTYIN